MNSVELSREDSTFKFPFTDSDDADLQLSKKFREGLHYRDNQGSSSEIGFALSPIAKDQDNSMGYLEGDSLSLDSVHSIENEPNQSQDHETNEKEIPIPQTENLETTMKQFGQRSNDFIAKMRDAANKRKAAVTRSRDSLVAKEQEQLRSIAECESRFATLQEKLQSVVHSHKENEPAFHRKNNKNKGFGGEGIQLVEKRRATKPVTPFKKKKGSQQPKGLSDKVSAFQPIAKSSNITIFNDKEAPKEKPSKPRSQHPKEKSLKPLKRNTMRKKSIGKEESSSKPKPSQQQQQQKSFGQHSTLKGVAPSTTQRWNAGQVGVPFIPKRRSRRLAARSDEVNNETSKPKPKKVPDSPPKRRSRRLAENVDDEAPKPETTKKNMLKRSSGSTSNSSRSIAISPSSVKTSPLLGLDFIQSTRKETTIAVEPDIEPVVEQRPTTTFQPTEFQPLDLQTTARAERRKEYDMYRAERQAITLQEKREQLQREIKALRRELRVLSKEI